MGDNMTKNLLHKWHWFWFKRHTKWLLTNEIENNSYKPIVCGNNSKPPKCTSAER